jgi:type IV secretion system protein VirB5
LQSQLENISGARKLGQIFNSPLLRNYVPPQAFAVLNAVDAAGYGKLSATAKALRDAAMVYNCLDRPEGATRQLCQAALALPYQHKGLLQDAMTSAAGRLGQIDALMKQVDATTDQKAVLEIQARIDAESALLAHEASQVQLLQAMADSEERIARSRDRERQYEMLRRAGRISDFLP